MSFYKNYPKRKDRRKPYHDARAVDPSCRNHKSCKWCLGNRLHSTAKRLAAACSVVLVWAHVSYSQTIFPSSTIDTSKGVATFTESLGDTAIETMLVDGSLDQVTLSNRYVPFAATRLVVWRMLWDLDEFMKPAAIGLWISQESRHSYQLSYSRDGRSASLELVCNDVLMAKLVYDGASDVVVFQQRPEQTVYWGDLITYRNAIEEFLFNCDLVRGGGLYKAAHK